MIVNMKLYFISWIILVTSMDNHNAWAKHEADTQEDIIVHINLLSSEGHVTYFPSTSDSEAKTPSYGVSFMLDNLGKIHIRLEAVKGPLLGPGLVSQWEEGNITVARLHPRHCWFAGAIYLTPGHNTHEHVPGSVSSIVSLCGGLRGVFLLNENEISIQPQHKTTHVMSRDVRHVITVRPMKKPASSSNIGDDNWRPVVKPESVGVDSAAAGDGHGREKRDLFHRSPRHMEVLLVADVSVVRFHGRSLVDQYLLTQLNIVNAAYHHTSLGVEINIVVVDIVYLSDAEMTALVTEEEGEKEDKELNGKGTLKRFCQWTNERWINSQVTGQQFDVAVYLTKHNIGPAGYAPVTGMCNPTRSCAVIKDDGISSAFVIAHEIGHIFGIVHDGEGDAESCGGDGPDGKIMATMVQSNYENFYWTNCSSAALESVLEDMHCLENEPVAPPWPRYSEPYGQSWTLDEQCRQEFGADYIFCQAIQHNCEHLWCEKSDDQICKTKKSPPLSGTSCGDNMWCLDRRCVSKKKTPRVDGGWSGWSEWGHCSQSCGVGVHYRYRTCTDPKPQYGGKQCETSGEDFRLCNQQPCEELEDTRAEQCTAYNEVNFLGDRRHNWLPMEHKNVSELCKLTCVSQQTGETFTAEKNAIDGTPCSYEVAHDICIKGECQRVGCDGRLHSTQKEDMCGTCGGDNSECTTVSDRYKGNLGKKQYHRILILPRHAMNIRIRESELNPHLAHFIAIRDPETEHFWLNGNEQQVNNRQFVIHKTRFMYFATKQGEALTARGPLLNPLEVMVYSYSEKLPTQIEYQYYLPTNVQSKVDSAVGPAIVTGRYQWAVVSHSSCTKPCGGGSRVEEYECLDVEKKTVSDGLCSLSHRPTGGTMTCNNGPCTRTIYTWESEPWMQCSSTCGTTGWRRRHVYCEANLYSDRWQVEPYYCNISTLPTTIEQCNRMSCPGQWRVSEWAPCSASCGEGFQRRSYQCVTPSDGNKYTCDHLQPPTTHRMCHTSSCPGVTYNSSTSGVLNMRNHSNSAADQTEESEEDSGDYIDPLDLTILNKDHTLNVNTISPRTGTGDVDRMSNRHKTPRDRKHKARRHKAKKVRNNMRTKARRSNRNGDKRRKNPRKHESHRTVDTIAKTKSNRQPLTDPTPGTPHTRQSPCNGDKSSVVCRAGATRKNCRRAMYQTLCCQSCADQRQRG